MKNVYNLLKRSLKKLLLMMILLTAAGYVSAQLSIAKDGTATSGPGKRITYRLIYQNTGTTVQHNVVITDPLPAFDGTYEGSFPAGNFDPSTGIITWTKEQIPELEVLHAGPRVIYIYGMAGKEINDANHKPGALYLTTSPQTLYNTATIRSDEVTTPVSSNTIQTVITQTCTGTLSNASGIIKSASNSLLKYVISVHNTGNVWNRWQLSASLVPGYQNLTATFEDMNGIPLNNNMTSWIEPGLSELVVMKLITPNGTNPSIGTGHAPNVTRVTATPSACGVPFYNDYTTEICGGQCPDYLFVSAYKIDTPDPVESGSTLTYQMILYNSFTDNQEKGLPVANITLTETYPALTSFQGSTPPLNNGNPVTHTLTGNNEWTFPSLPPGMTTFFITVKVDDNRINNTNIINRVDLTHPAAGATPFDTWYENTLVRSAHDLWVLKTANATNGKKNDEITYTLTYGNKGTFQGDDVSLVDNYDETYMDVVDAGGATVTNGTLVWQHTGPMPIGFSGTKTYTLKIKSTATFPEGTTNIKNTAIIYNNRQPVIAFDKNYEDNQSDWMVYVVNLPDLTISKTANPNTVSALASPGAQVTYTISVSNIGDLNHTGWYDVKDFLPAGVTYVSSNNAGTYDSGTHSVTWSENAALQINAVRTFTVTVGGITFDMGGSTLSNRARVASRLSTEKSLTNNETTVLTPLIYPNYWLGNISTDWAVAGNWTYGIPGTGEGDDLIDDDVIFATALNYSSAAQRDLILDQDRQIGKLINASDFALRIPTDKTLKINETAVNNAPERLRLESEPGLANGALIFNYPNLNPGVQASVEFASKSKPGTGTWPRVWQYFGTPVKNKTLTNLFGTNVQGSIYGGDPTVNTIVRKYDESWVDPQSYQEKWRDISPADNVIIYTGYEITQPQSAFDNAGTTPYVFKGPLVADVDFTIPLIISPAGTYARGNYILANPYAAPIFISNMLGTDFTNLAQTIYLYNTGSRQDWLTNNGANEDQIGDLPGTYTTIPIDAATTLGKTQIPSMQGFMVKASADVSPTSFKFRYATVNRGTLTYLNEPMRVKSAETTNSEIMPLLTMDVIGESGSDRVYLITAPGTTKSYDAGWDGYKTLSTDNVQLFALDADSRRMQVNTDNNLNDTYIGFLTGGESMYSLRFKFNNEMQGVYESLFIQDLATGTTQEITDGMMMSFAPAAGTAEKRFKLSADKNITGVNTRYADNTIKLAANSSNITVNNNTNTEVVVTVYNLIGQDVLTERASVGTQSFSHNLLKGTYIIEAKSINNSSKTILKAIIN